MSNYDDQFGGSPTRPPQWALDEEQRSWDRYHREQDAAEIARLRARLAEAEALLREVDGMMATWFSSEYAEHPVRAQVAAFLRGGKGDR